MNSVLASSPGFTSRCARTSGQTSVNGSGRVGHVDACPFFNKETVQQQVAELPDKIELEDSAWAILYKEKCDNSTVQQVPVGIQPKQAFKRNRWSYYCLRKRRNQSNLGRKPLPDG